MSSASLWEWGHDVMSAIGQMGKQRRFKPQGMDNPLLLGRSEESEPSGASIEDRIAERHVRQRCWGALSQEPRTRFLSPRTGLNRGDCEATVCGIPIVLILAG